MRFHSILVRDLNLRQRLLLRWTHVSDVLEVRRSTDQILGELSKLPLLTLQTIRRAFMLLGFVLVDNRNHNAQHLCSLVDIRKVQRHHAILRTSNCLALILISTAFDLRLPRTTASTVGRVQPSCGDKSPAPTPAGDALSSTVERSKTSARSPSRSTKRRHRI